MACACGKSATKQQFNYTAPDGSTKVYKTEIEARAAQIRNGGGTYTAVPIR